MTDDVLAPPSFSTPPATFPGAGSFPALVDARYSVRAYTDEPVAPEVLTEFLTIAQRTPSWSNSQTWHVHVLQGAALTRVSTELEARVRARTPETGSDLPLPGSFTDTEHQRRRETGYGRYAALGIDRSDRAGRAEASYANFSFFGAPVGIVVTSTRSVGPYGWVDAGAWLTTAQYLARDMGLGACALGSMGMQADIVHELLGIGDGQDVVAGLALGHPDHAAPGNSYRTTRAPLDEAVTHID
ncbi:nitroreductase [Brevibacterium litoralis]|uniref:nitroreductase n=1 Tax=Brevibacterium litoralis TaxID=3138935 RepID=UPI0032EDB89C